MTKPEINWVCDQCGIAANILTCLIKYGHIPLKAAFEVSTFSTGTCDCCGRETEITQVREFFHPDFSLLSRKFKNQLSNQKDTV